MLTFSLLEVNTWYAIRVASSLTWSPLPAAALNRRGGKCADDVRDIESPGDPPKKENLFGTHLDINKTNIDKQNTEFYF